MKIQYSILIAVALLTGPVMAEHATDQICPDPRYRDPLSPSQDCDYSEFIRFCHGDDCDKSEELVRWRRNPAYLVPKSQAPNGLPVN